MAWIEWVFSGIGVAVGAALCSWIWQRRRKATGALPVGARISDSTSRSGGATAIDETGRGAVVENSTVAGELSARSSVPKADTTPKV